MPDASMRIVVLTGKDSFLRVERSRQLQDALEASFGAVDRFDLDGASASLSAVLDELRTIEIKKDQVVINFDNTGDRVDRVIRLNAQHPAKVKPSRHGDSVGKWDGDTLVVDIVGFNDESWIESLAALKSVMVSTFTPPVIALLNTNVSCPAPPARVSLPGPPLITSLPLPPWMLSLPELPVSLLAKLLPMIDQYRRAHPFVEFVPISGIDGTNVEEAAAQLEGKPGHYSYTSVLSIDDAEALFK